MTGIALCPVHALASAEVSCPIGPDQTDAYLETIFDRILHNEIVMNEEGEEGAGVDVSSVALYAGTYDASIKQEFPEVPDLVLGFDVDAYTCSWRGTLLYLVGEQLPTMPLGGSAAS